MEITSFWPLIFFAVGVQGVFLSSVLFLQKKVNRSNIYLALLLLLFSISIVDTIVFWALCACEDPYWLGISMIFIFLYGPLFYFFLSGSGKAPIRHQWKHLVASSIILFWHIYFLASTRVSGAALISASTDRLINTILLPILGLISLAFYGYRSFTYIAKLEKKYEIKILRSWHWLGLIFKAYLLFTLFHFIFFMNIVSGSSTQNADIIIILGYSLIIYAIGYLALKTSKLLNGIKVDTNKYQSGQLPKSFSDSIYEKVQVYMDTHKPYKDNEIKLADLASALSLSPHQLSQVINQNAHQNFAEFINAYRVREAITLITQIDRFNQLAYEVGFNNRTTFNQVFKSTTGYTPTEYKKQVITNRLVKE